MLVSISAFNSDRGLPPNVLAPLIESAGFDGYYFPEHTHIPVSTAFPHALDTGDDSVKDTLLRSLDPWTSIASAAATTKQIRLGTAVALPVQHDLLALAKTTATLDFLSGGRLTLGVGFGWNLPELRQHGVQIERRRTMLREYLEAMRSIWTEEISEYHGEFVDFSPSMAWPKPVQEHIPIRLGCAATEKNFRWIAKNADGWISGLKDDIEPAVRMLGQAWADEGRAGRPSVTVVDLNSDGQMIEKWQTIGVDEVLYGLPETSASATSDYLGNLMASLQGYGGLSDRPNSDARSTP